ncbi:hypothetical protein QZH41_004803 [Actinostola sp. cb2023]|nr:hypothetical protein QZH41_004803 [Actinostola sp. cb2023]
MSYYDRKYRDLDSSYDKIMHSTPKKSRDEYGSRVSSSYVPGELSTATENHISNISQSENVSVKTGVTSRITQSVKKSSVSSTRSSGYSSEEGRKEDEIGSSDILNSRISRALGSPMDVEAVPSRSGIRSSIDDKYSTDKSKQNDLGFQYEDIKSFRERQKVEGDRLEMHRQSLTGNIVGTGKYGAMKSDYSVPSSGASSGLANKGKDSDVSMFTSLVTSSSGDSDRRSSHDDDPLSRENLLAEARRENKDIRSGIHSSSSDYKVSSERRSFHDDDPLSREKLLAEARSKGAGIHSSSSDYKVSSERRSFHDDDPLSREKLLAEARSKGAGIHSSSSDYKVSSEHRSFHDDDPLSREKLLAEARSKGAGIHSSSSDYKVSSERRSFQDDDPLSREKLLAEARSKGAGIHSSSSDYKVSSERRSFHDDDPLSREKLLAEARSKGAGIHSSSSDYKVSSERRSFHDDDPLSREKLLAEARSKGAGIHSSSSDYKVSSERRSFHDDDPLSREKLLAEARSKGAGIHSSSSDYKVSSERRSFHDDDPLSRKNLLASSSHDFRYSKELSRSKEDIGASSKDRLLSEKSQTSASSDVDSRLHSSSSLDDKLGKGGDLGDSHDDRFSKSDALVSKYLQSSRYKGHSKYGVDLDSDHKLHHSQLTGIKEEGRDDVGKKDDRHRNEKDRTGSEVKHHSVGGKPMSYLPSSSSYEDLLQKKRESNTEAKTGDSNLSGITNETHNSSRFSYSGVTSSKSSLQPEHSVSKTSDITGGSGETSDLSRRLNSQLHEDRKARQDAIDRLLDSTRRYSSESIFDKKSHDKKLDEVIGAITSRELDSTASHYDRHVKETKLNEKTASDRDKYPSVFKEKNDKIDVLRREDRETGATKPEDNRRGSQGIDGAGSTDRYRPRLSRDLSSDDKPRSSVFHDNGTTKQGVTTQEERFQKYRYNNSSSYETPYTSLDHSYQPGLTGKSIDDGRIYNQPLNPGESPDKRHPESSYPDSRNASNQYDIPDKSDYDRGPGAMRKTTEGRPQEIYDKLRRGSDQVDKPKQEPGYAGPSGPDERRGSIEGIFDDLEPLYDHLNLSSGSVPQPSRGRVAESPVPISDHYSLPLDKYDKPVAVHGTAKDPSKPDVPGREIVSRHSDLRDYGISDYKTEQHVTETTRTSFMQRSFMSRNGEVVKDEVKHHEEVHHGGENAMEGSERRESNLPTRIQRYPAARVDDLPKDRRTSATDITRTTEEVRRTREVTGADRKNEGRRDSTKLDDILKMAGMKDTGDTTKYQEQTRKEEVTRISDNSNVRTKVHRTDVSTNVNIVKEIVKEKKEKPKSGKTGIAGLRSKIEALTKSVDELMNLKRKTLLKSYVQEHADRRPSKDIEALPKPEHYEVKSKRYEPDIKFDEVDYAHKEVEIEKSPKRPEIDHSQLNIENLWVSEEHHGTDIGLHIPKQINLIPSGEQLEWWNAPTAEEADRFLCIGDWQWWNANTTEGVDHILGIRAINKETGAAGAIIAKYQGDEKPIEWAWLQAPQQPSPAQKRRTLTRVLKKDNKGGDDWWNAPTAEDADKYLSIGHYQWWDDNTGKGVDQVLGMRGSSEETGTILATYTGGTKPTAWTWVHTSEQPSDHKEEKRHTLTRSSRDLYIDETNAGNVELLIRVKDQETTTQQPPRYVAIRPGPVEKAIIIRDIREGDIPSYASDVRLEGQGGQGLQIQDGVIKMRIKDMTPEARNAWVNIMGMQRNDFKLQENETVEIPVTVVDHPKPKAKEDIYAIPMKKKKKILQKGKVNEDV